MLTRRALLSLLVALPLALAAGACGDDGPLVRGRALRVRLTEYRIDPQDVRVPAGRLTIVARNDGVLTHNVRVESADETDDNGDPLGFGGTDTAHPGETVRANVTLKPGRYRISCSIANHQNLGQYGELTVVKAGD